jgi:hypothetical protein
LGFFWFANVPSGNPGGKIVFLVNAKKKFCTQPWHRSYQKLVFQFYTNVCKIFLQICVKFLTNLWKMNPTKIVHLFVSLI